MEVIKPTREKKKKKLKKKFKIQQDKSRQTHKRYYYQHIPLLSISVSLYTYKIYLSIYLSTNLSLYPSIYLFIYLFIYLAIFLYHIGVYIKSLYICMYIYVYVSILFSLYFTWDLYQCRLQRWERPQGVRGLIHASTSKAGAQQGGGRWERASPTAFHYLAKDMSLTTQFKLGLMPCIILFFLLQIYLFKTT